MRCLAPCRTRRMRLLWGSYRIVSSAEAREVEDPAFMWWFNQNAAICETVDTENGNDELIADGSGPGDFDDNDNTKEKDVGDSAENVNDEDDDNVVVVDDDDDDDDDDDNYDDGFSDINDDDVSIETLEDDVASFHHMGFLRECGRLGSRMPDHRRHHGHRHHQHHCPRINWIQQPDLYAEFGFKPPASKPDSIYEVKRL